MMTNTSRTPPRAVLRRRPFKDDAELSIVGMGGLIFVDMPQPEVDALVHWALERGVNYVDVGPTYPVHDIGLCEKKLGLALEGHRDGVFLACKTTERTAAGAAREFEESLGRLRTDRFDLYQFHGVSRMQDVETILAPGGAAEVLLREKAAGRCRYIGLSAHSEEVALALMDTLPLDSVLFPVNYACFARTNFGPKVLARAREKGMARMAIKALAKRPYAQGESRPYPYCWYRPHDEPDAIRRALFFTLSEDLTSAIAPADAGLFRACVEVAQHFRPLEPAEREALLNSAGPKAILPHSP